MLIVGARCDKCGREITWPQHMCKKNLLHMLRECGWSVSSTRNEKCYQERTLCQACKKKKK